MPKFYLGGFTLKKICSFIVKDMVFFILLVSFAAAWQPLWFTWIGSKIPWLLGIVMLGMGMTLKVENFCAIWQHPRNVCIGFIAQFIIMPTVAFGLVKLFQLPAELAVGVILVGTSPGATASNVITYLAKGDVALSVSISLVTTLLAPLVTPMLTWFLAGTWINISLTAMIASIAKIVLVPVIFGLLIHYFLNDFTQKCIPYLPAISVITIILIVGGVVSLSAAVLWQVGIVIAAVVICHNLLGLALGYGAATLFHMTPPQEATIAIETGMRNSGLAVSLAMLYFTPVTAIPGVIFSIWHNMSGSLIATYFARRNQIKTSTM